jgi:ferredoxin
MVKLVVTHRDGRVAEISAQAGISLMENIRDLDGGVEAICGGMCACATCHVLIDAEWNERLNPRSFGEQMMLQDLESFDPARSRLSCQILVTDALENLSFTIAPEDY